MGTHINKREGHYRKGTRIYNIWKNMRARCHNSNHPNFKYYGGKGVVICGEWNDIIVFEKWALENGYKDDLTIDRMDSNGNYEPDNCRWATREEQSNNKCSNVKITHNGITLGISQWAYKLGGKSHMVISRLRRGWTDSEAVSIPFKATRNQFYKRIS
jgi:hypothetical protein